MKFRKIEKSSELHDIYTPDKETEAYNDDGVVAGGCEKVLVIRVKGKLISTSNWFITKRNNELIYEIEKNDWVNLTMFDNGESVCDEIYYIYEEEL